MNKPEFNKGKCHNGCNCIEIAEFENDGHVKNYNCLGIDSIFNKDRLKIPVDDKAREINPEIAKLFSEFYK